MQPFKNNFFNTPGCFKALECFSTLQSILFWTTMIENSGLLWMKRFYYTCCISMKAIGVSGRSPVHNAVWHRNIWASATCNRLAVWSGVAGRSHRCICSSFHCSVICNADLLYESWNKTFYLLASSLYYQIKNFVNTLWTVFMPFGNKFLALYCGDQLHFAKPNPGRWVFQKIKQHQTVYYVHMALYSAWQRKPLSMQLI